MKAVLIFVKPILKKLVQVQGDELQKKLNEVIKEEGIKKLNDLVDRLQEILIKTIDKL